MMSDLANKNSFALQQQLNDALNREKMLTVMLMNQTQLKTSQRVRFMSLGNGNNSNSVPPSPSMGPQSTTVPMIQTPSILSMASSQSAPMLPMMTPSAMMTPNTIDSEHGI